MREARTALRIEWPTLLMLAACHALWVLAMLWAAALWLPLGIGLAGLAIALHSSLSHEALHYRRFRDLHLAHHRGEMLTDSYDDRRNGRYRYRSCAQVFSRHFLHAKDEVAHPFRPGGAAAPARPR